MPERNTAGPLCPQDATHIGDAARAVLLRLATLQRPDLHKRALTAMYEAGVIDSDALAAEIAKHGLRGA